MLEKGKAGLQSVQPGSDTTIRQKWVETKFQVTPSRTHFCAAPTSSESASAASLFKIALVVSTYLFTDAMSACAGGPSGISPMTGAAAFFGVCDKELSGHGDRGNATVSFCWTAKKYELGLHCSQRHAEWRHRHGRPGGLPRQGVANRMRPHRRAMHH